MPEKENLSFSSVCVINVKVDSGWKYVNGQCRLVEFFMIVGLGFFFVLVRKY